MIHRPWPLVDRFVDTMADSSLLDSINVASVLQREPRSSGLHMSTLLHLLCPPKSSDDINERQLSVYGLLGLAFEDRAELALHKLATEADWPYLAVRPGEVDWYGIKGSPDILLTPKPEFAHSHIQRELSLKVKWRSSRGTPKHEGDCGFPPKWDYEIQQCMAYSDPLKTRGSILCVYFVCGDWKPPMPHVKAWELEFTEEEVGETMNGLATIAEGLLLEEEVEF
jgi:hypothetical protein